jgi:hypothetical protein
VLVALRLDQHIEDLALVDGPPKVDRCRVGGDVAVPPLSRVGSGADRASDDADVSLVPHHSVRRVFPGTGGRLACQMGPSEALVGLSLLLAYAASRSVCVHPSCIDRKSAAIIGPK